MPEPEKSGNPEEIHYAAAAKVAASNQQLMQSHQKTLRKLANIDDEAVDKLIDKIFTEHKDLFRKLAE